MRSLSAVIGFVLVASASNVRQKGSACSLLTVAEIGSIVGAKAGEPQANDAVTPANGQLRSCMWPVQSDKGGLTVGIGLLPPGTTGAAITKKNAGMDALRKAKYTFVEKDYANAYCSIASPPASVKDGVFLSSCGGGTGTIVSVAYMSGTRKLTLEQVKALFDKASSRQR